MQATMVFHSIFLHLPKPVRSLSKYWSFRIVVLTRKILKLRSCKYDIVSSWMVDMPYMILSIPEWLICISLSSILWIFFSTTISSLFMNRALDQKFEKYLQPRWRPIHIIVMIVELFLRKLWNTSTINSTLMLWLLIWYHVPAFILFILPCKQ